MQGLRKQALLFSAGKNAANVQAKILYDAVRVAK
jgi:hypothetical protein